MANGSRKPAVIPSKLSISLPNDMLVLVKEHAKKMDRASSWIVQQALMDYLDKHCMDEGPNVTPL